MSAHASLLAIPESPVRGARPLFYAQKPDGRRDWTEPQRVNEFRRLLGDQAPSLKRWHVANEGKRHQSKAASAGIVAGVFDEHIASGIVGARATAYCEFKGYDAAGRPGKLSDAQIEWGNDMYRAGHPVAMYFCPHAAVAWLRTVFPAAFMGSGL